MKPAKRVRFRLEGTKVSPDIKNLQKLKDAVLQKMDG